ncbi:MAG: hypothetical protein JXR34_04105 [Bacteroidales bacterium]|nr:hypothetical protein [Bacteroidales bacterium]
MKCRFKILFILFFLTPQFSLHAGDFEDYTWWNKTHNYDGVSPWTSYLKTSAAWFGPNAMAPPSLNKALINNQFRLELRPEFHYSKGDQTVDLFTSLHIPLAKNVDFHIHIVPVEYFQLDSATRHQRYVRHIDASGVEGGDFWFGTNFQIFNEKKHGIDVLASAYFKTASGTGLEYARFTDAPGYYLSFSFGKYVGRNLQKDNRPFRFYGHLGFFAYQTWDFLHNQNDCVLYGAGVQWKNAGIQAHLEWNGYLGYLNNGDRPSVLNFKLGTNNRIVNYHLTLQNGIHDYEYFTMGIGVSVHFGKPISN